MNTSLVKAIEIPGYDQKLIICVEYNASVNSSGTYTFNQYKVKSGLRAIAQKHREQCNNSDSFWVNAENLLQGLERLSKQIKAFEEQAKEEIHRVEKAKAVLESHGFLSPETIL